MVHSRHRQLVLMMTMMPVATIFHASRVNQWMPGSSKVWYAAGPLNRDVAAEVDETERQV